MLPQIYLVTKVIHFEKVSVFPSFCLLVVLLDPGLVVQVDAEAVALLMVAAVGLAFNGSKRN